jgi:hypothetical protein
VQLGLQVGGDPVLAVRRQHWLLLTCQLALFIAGGLSVLSLAIADYWEEKNADSLFLGLWVAGTFVFAAFINYTVNARSLLPLIPPAGILLARRCDKIPAARRGRTQVQFACALLLSGLVSLWVASGDAELADSARQAAERIHQRTHGQSGALWFEGHWGFQYYMELLAARPLDLENPQAQPGDFIAIPTNNINLRPIPPQAIASVDSFALPLRTGASTICSQLGAGFYSFYWGPLPYAFGPIPAERYVIVRVAQQQ